MRLTFDQAADLLDQLAEPFPEALFEGLNGGVNLLEDVKPDPDFPDACVMGEYCHDLLGRYINIYYGSFAVLSEQEDWTLEDWGRELRETLAHELTHHMEYRSGLHALEDKDAEQLAAWREDKQNKRRNRKG